ncbi:MAG: response regulator [Chloroflexota bacterium]|nr:response regulator [Chloroflexota bacterium]
MVENNTPVLIVSRPGRVRDGLQALLTAMPQIGAVDLVDDGLSVLNVATKRRPALVLLDTHTPSDEIHTTLRNIKTMWPQTPCIVLASNGRQQRDARAAGADGVLLKGYPATQLFAIVEGLLS